MEPVGLALGAAGLLTAFNSCLEALELIDLGKAHARDATLLEQLFENQQYRLVAWAKTNFPSVYQTNAKLLSDEVKQRLLKNLACITLLFHDRDRLGRLYGLGPNLGIEQEGQILAFRSLVQHLGGGVKRRQSTTGLGLITSWAIRDRRKFRELVDDVSRFITDLEMTTQALSSQPDDQRAVFDESQYSRGIKVNWTDTPELIGIEIERQTQRHPIALSRIVGGDAKKRAVEARDDPRTLVGGTKTPANTLAPLPPSIEPSLWASNARAREGVSYPSILFADFGNSCRSPMAEAILKHMTSSSATKLIISSGGTGGKTALAPTDARTISTLRRHGIDLQQRAPRAVVDEDFRTFSRILAMDDSDLASLMIMRSRGRRRMGEQHLCAGDGAEVRLFGPFSRGVREVVPDPYSGGEGKFERAYQQMRRLACELLLEFGFGTGEF